MKRIALIIACLLVAVMASTAAADGRGRQQQNRGGLQFNFGNGGNNHRHNNGFPFRLGQNGGHHHHNNGLPLGFGFGNGYGNRGLNLNFGFNRHSLSLQAFLREQEYLRRLEQLRLSQLSSGYYGGGLQLNFGGGYSLPQSSGCNAFFSGGY